MFASLLLGFLIIFILCVALWLVVKLIKIIIKNHKIRYIFLSIILIIFIIFGGFYFWGKYKKNKIEQKFCSETQWLDEDQLYKRAMASYFQSIKEKIVFEKTKRKGDGNAKTFNASYNLFVLKENIRNFDDLKKSFKEQVENIYDLNEKGKNNIPSRGRGVEGISYGSIVVLTDYAKIRDNININNHSFYQQSNNKYSFLFAIHGFGKWQNFYPTDCCKIIRYKDVLKVQQNKLKENEKRQRKYHVSDVPKVKYFLLVLDYTYELNIDTSELKKNYFESKAHPINVCGQINYDNFFGIDREIKHE